jgi:uncharacterized integral membrane protein
MRARTIALILAIVVVAAFVALNVDEFTRSSVLSLGFTTIQAPLGLVMLALLAAAAVILLGAMIYMQSSNLLETRNYARELSTQRELADKAEASRFTELRHYLEAQTAAQQRREQAAEQVLSERFAAQNRLLLARLEQTDNSLAAYMGQLEDRIERREKTHFMEPTDSFKSPLV